MIIFVLFITKWVTLKDRKETRNLSSSISISGMILFLSTLEPIRLHTSRKKQQQQH